MTELSLQEKLDLRTLLSDTQPFKSLIARVMDGESAQWRSRAFNVTFSKGLTNEERMNRIIEHNAKAAAFDAVVMTLERALGKFNPIQFEDEAA